MKNLLNCLTLTVILFSVRPLRAAVDFTGSGGNFSAVSPGAQTIPDFPGSGLAFALQFNHPDYNQITSISFTFTTTGGWNGDLYAYLSHGDGFGVLLNRVG